MDLDGVFALIYFLLHWRVFLCLGTTGVLAIVLVNAFPWLTPMQGIGLGVLGFIPGAAWQVKSDWPSNNPPPPTQPAAKTTTGVAMAAATILGGFWGALSASSLQSFVAGAIIFFAGAKAWSWLASDVNAWVDRDRVYWCVGSAAFAYVLAAMLTSMVQ